MRSSIQPCLSSILPPGPCCAISVYEKPTRFGPILGQEKYLPFGGPAELENCDGLNYSWPRIQFNASFPASFNPLPALFAS